MSKQKKVKADIRAARKRGERKVTSTRNKRSARRAVMNGSTNGTGTPPMAAPSSALTWLAGMMAAAASQKEGSST